MTEVRGNGRRHAPWSSRSGSGLKGLEPCANAAASEAVVTRAAEQRGSLAAAAAVAEG